MTYANCQTTAPMTNRAAVWSGLLLSGLAMAFLTLDGAMKLVPLSVVTETMASSAGQPTPRQPGCWGR